MATKKTYLFKTTKKTAQKRDVFLDAYMHVDT